MVGWFITLVLPSYVYLFHWHNSESVYTYTSPAEILAAHFVSKMAFSKRLAWGDMPPPSLAVQPMMYLTTFDSPIYFAPRIYYVLGYLLRCCTKQKLQVGSDQKSSTTTTSPVGNNLEVVGGTIKCPHILLFH